MPIFHQDLPQTWQLLGDLEIIGILNFPRLRFTTNQQPMHLQSWFIGWDLASPLQLVALEFKMDHGSNANKKRTR